MIAVAPPVVHPAAAGAEPAGAVRLRLRALGIDHWASDFSARFSKFCEQNDLYRAGRAEPEILDDPESLDGEDALPGFTFPVRRYIFDLE